MVNFEPANLNDQRNKPIPSLGKEKQMLLYQGGWGFKTGLSRLT